MRGNGLNNAEPGTVTELRGAIDGVLHAVQDLTMVAKKLEMRIRELEEREAQWLEDEKSGSGAQEDVVCLNVGGQRFTTTRATLMKYSGSLFEEMLASGSPHSEKNRWYFIDRDPSHFGIVLKYMRDGKVRNSDLKSVDPDDLQEEFQFYRIPFGSASSSSSSSVSSFSSSASTSMSTSSSTSTSTSTSIAAPKQVVNLQPVISEEEIREKVQNLFEGGTLLAPSHKLKLSEWLPKKKFTLQYKATRDGFNAFEFHQLCDKKGPTLTVIQSKDGHLFGGYTSASWDLSSTHKNDPTAFIFTLTNPHSIAPTKYIIKPTEVSHAICCYGFYGPVFGRGHDIQVCPLSNETSNSWTNFPTSYIDTTSKGKETFTGAMSFSTTDVEVYSVV